MSVKTGTFTCTRCKWILKREVMSTIPSFLFFCQDCERYINNADKIEPYQEETDDNRGNK